MKHARLLQLLGITIFIIISSQTYAIVTPVINTPDTSIGKLTDGISATTTSTTVSPIGDNSIITIVYRTLTSLATGSIIAVLTMFFFRFLLIEKQEKHKNARCHR